MALDMTNPVVVAAQQAKAGKQEEFYNQQVEAAVPGYTQVYSGGRYYSLPSDLYARAAAGDVNARLEVSSMTGASMYQGGPQGGVAGTSEEPFKPRTKTQGGEFGSQPAAAMASRAAIADYTDVNPFKPPVKTQSGEFGEYPSAAVSRVAAAEFQKQAELAAIQRANYYGLPSENLPEAKTIGDSKAKAIAESARIMSMFGMADPMFARSEEYRTAYALESLRQVYGGSARSASGALPEYEPTKRAQYYSGELQKLASRPIEQSSEYHYLAMSSGISMPANPFEYQGDLAVHLLKGSPERAGDWFSPVSGEMSKTLPGGWGLQSWSWQAALHTDNKEQPSAPDMNFLPAIRQFAEAKGQYGPYGSLFGGPDYKGTPSSEGIRKQEDFVYTEDARSWVDIALAVSADERRSWGSTEGRVVMPIEEPVAKASEPAKAATAPSSAVPWWADYPQNEGAITGYEQSKETGRIKGSKTVATVATTIDSMPTIMPEPQKQEYEPSGLFGIGGLFPKIGKPDLNIFAKEMRENPIGRGSELLLAGVGAGTSVISGAASKVTFGLTDIIYKPKVNEWDKFVEGSGRVSRAATGLTLAKQDAYFETIAQESGLMGEAKRGLFYAGTEVINKPADLAPAAITGVTVAGAGSVAGGAVSRLAYSEGLTGTVARKLLEPGSAALTKALTVAVFGGAYTYGVTDKLTASPEKTKENIARSVPALAAMYAGAGGMNWMGEVEIARGRFAGGTTFEGVAVRRDVFVGAGKSPEGARYAGAFSRSGNEFYGVMERSYQKIDTSFRPQPRGALPDLDAAPRGQEPVYSYEPRPDISEIAYGNERGAFGVIRDVIASARPRPGKYIDVTPTAARAPVDAIRLPEGVGRVYKVEPKYSPGGMEATVESASRGSWQKAEITPERYAKTYHPTTTERAGLPDLPEKLAVPKQTELFYSRAAKVSPEMADLADRLERFYEEPVRSTKTVIPGVQTKQKRINVVGVSDEVMQRELSRINAEWFNPSHRGKMEPAFGSMEPSSEKPLPFKIPGVSDNTLWKELSKINRGGEEGDYIPWYERGRYPSTIVEDIGIQQKKAEERRYPGPVGFPQFGGGWEIARKAKERDDKKPMPVIGNWPKALPSAREGGSVTPDTSRGIEPKPEPRQEPDPWTEPKPEPWQDKFKDTDIPRPIITTVPGGAWFPSFEGGTPTRAIRKGSRSYVELLGFEFSKRTDPFRRTKRKPKKWGRI